MTRKTKSRTDSGQGLVEFVFALPVLMLVIYGIFQFAGAYNHYINLTDGTRAGARKAVVSRTGTSDPTSAIKQAVKSSAADLDPATLDPRITITPACNWSTTTNSCTGWSVGSTVTITATYPYDIDLLGKVVSSGDLRSSTSERIE